MISKTISQIKALSNADDSKGGVLVYDARGSQSDELSVEGLQALVAAYEIAQEALKIIARGNLYNKKSTAMGIANSARLEIEALDAGK